MAAPEACRDDRADADRDGSRLEERRDADQKDDFADRQVLLDRRVQWDAENTDDLDHPGRLVADASADQSALAGRDADRSDDHRKEADHDSPLV